MKLKYLNIYMMAFYMTALLTVNSNSTKYVYFYVRMKWNNENINFCCTSWQKKRYF